MPSALLYFFFRQMRLIRLREGGQVQRGRRFSSSMPCQPLVASDHPLINATRESFLFRIIAISRQINKWNVVLSVEDMLLGIRFAC